MVSFESELKMLLKTGKIAFGANKAMKAARLGKAKLIIIASNIPEDIKDDILYYSRLSKIPVYMYRGTSIELGTLCGKPFMISTITVYDPGSSNVLELVKEEGAQIA